MKVISLGLGVQSTALYLLSSIDYSISMIERADYAIFADPGAEHPETYKLFEKLLTWAKENNGIPIIYESKSLYKDLLHKISAGERVASIPAFSKNGEGILRRQCTEEYKISPVMKGIRKLHGLKPRQRMPMTEVWLGISMDEVQRMKDSQLPRVTYKYPLVDMGYTRSTCTQFLENRGFIDVVKSSCTFCPYQSDYSWKRLKTRHPEEFDKAIQIDNAIRHNPKLKEETYLHRSCKPINDVDFESQQDMFDELCEGYCGL